MSTLLYFAAGITEWDRDTDRSARPYPSAGSVYCLEAYVLARAVQGLDPGVYHYDVLGHRLDVLLPSYEGMSSMPGIWRGQEWADEAHAIVVLTAVFRRIMDRYGKQGLAYALIEAGHLAQNLYLLATEMQVQCCTIGELHEAAIVDVLDLALTDEVPVYYAALGR